MSLQGKGRFDFAEKCKPLIDSIITRHFGVDSCQWMNDTYVDINLGIDVIARINSQPLTYQVKCLNQDYKTITVETSGVDRQGNAKPGDWVTTLAQMSIYMYSFDGETVARYVIIDNTKLILANSKKLSWRSAKNKYSHSEFKFIDVAQIIEKAPEVILAIEGEWK